LVLQVNSGKYPGLVWEDEAKTMFRIPWKHAGKQDFRKDEDAAIFKAWAAFKGKLSDGDQDNPACWKTRLRCALNKSPEFTEVLERAQLDISDPYKVYRLVPFSEQGMVVPDKKSRAKAAKRPKRRRSSQLAEDDSSQVKVKKREVTSPPSARSCWTCGSRRASLRPLKVTRRSTEDRSPPAVDSAPFLHPPVQDSFEVAVCYLGQEVLKRRVQGADIRILYLPSSPLPPTPAGIGGRFPRLLLPDPPTSLPAEHGLFKLLPFMQHGVVLTSMTQGVYGKRFCQGRVFWTGPHTTSPGPHKMEQNTEPVLLFSKDVFKQQLDHFRSKRRRAASVWHHAVFGRRAERRRRPVGEAHHSEGEGSGFQHLCFSLSVAAGYHAQT
ncbi:unnamed protein product, partial [Tetraodon nigroviridis]